MWGKLVNSGQTCIAPDYVLCTKAIEEKLVAAAPKIIKEFFGEDAKASPDYSRIINQAHFNRLKKLLDSTSGKIEYGGQTEESERYIAPTLVSGVKAEDALMQEEIFGPILPIVTVADLDEAIAFINRGEKPLSLYVFSNKTAVLKRFEKETSSGAIVGNDTLLHYTVDSLPFGGVGNSGMGNYHGKYSFDTFTHKKAVLARDYNPIAEALAGNRYPPYNSTKVTILRLLLQKRNFGFLSYVPYALVFGLGVAVGLIPQFIG
jgi:acyl-CoA reductase-like NAD-dependent aldehyde dehydrogenase